MISLTSLTPRQYEMAGLVAEGLPNKAIAARLYVSEYTVKTTLAAVFRKMEVASRAELAALVAAREVRVRSAPQVAEILTRSLKSLKEKPEPKWGSAEWYRREGAVAVLRSLIDQLGKVTT